MSVYNDIYKGQRKNGEKYIGIICNPDQYSKDSITLDEDDYWEIREKARQLGWELGIQPEAYEE